MTTPTTGREEVTGGAARTIPRARGAGIGQRLREAPGLAWRSLDKFFGEGMPTHAAALSFLTMVSLPALLTLLLLLVGIVADPLEVQRGIIEETGGLIGRAGAEQVRTVLAHASRAEVNPTLTAVLGFAFLLFGATGAFASLQGALNKAWGVKPDPKRGQVRNFLAKRVFSFGVVVTVAFLLLVSLALSAALAALGLRRDRGAIRGDVQGAAGRPRGLARRARRRAQHRPPLRAGQVGHRPLPRRLGPGERVRRGRLARGGADLGLLLLDARALRRRAHARVGGAVRAGRVAGEGRRGGDGGGEGDQEGLRPLRADVKESS
jgi:hypothetical protein